MLDEKLKKELEANIATSLKRGSFFVYSKDSQLVCDRENAKEIVIAEGRAQSLAAINGITMRDFYILASVITLVYATVPTIKDRLMLEKRRNADCGIPAELELRDLRKRLDFLVSSGFLYGFTYISDCKDGRIDPRFYVATQVAVEACKAYFTSLSRSCDKLALYRPVPEIMARLMTNAVAMAFSKKEECGGVLFNERYTYARDTQRNAVTIIKARVTMNSAGVKKSYIVEPVYFGLEPGRVTKEEHIANLHNRLDELRLVMEHGEREKSWDCKFVFVVPTFGDLKELLSLLETKDMNFWMARSLFTSDCVIAANGFDITNSFLQLKFVSDSYRFKLYDASIC